MKNKKDQKVNTLFYFPRSKLIRVENFEAYFKKQQADSNCGFAEEYEVHSCKLCFLPFVYGKTLGEEAV